MGESGYFQPMFQMVNRIMENRVLTHVLYWLGIVLVYVIPATIITQSPEPLVNKLCYLPSQILATYGLIYYQIPRLVYQKKYGQFMVSLIVSIYVTTVIARIFKVYVYETVLGADLPKDPFVDILTQMTPLLGQYFLWVYLPAILTLILKSIKDHFRERERMETLLKEKAQAELNFLKAQIHPHFLFNTLNNLYTLTLRKSDLAPQTVRKLSDILRYMFYQCKAPAVPVREEVQLLQNYIDLELLRYGDRLDFVFETKIANPEARIAPLVLLSMVENAFKHGASGAIGRPQVHIHLEEKNGALSFRVFNSKPPVQKTDETDHKRGIGVSNIKRQLELLYAGHYHLEINETPSTYTVQLQIDLAPISSLELVP